MMTTWPVSWARVAAYASRELKITLTKLLSAPVVRAQRIRESFRGKKIITKAITAMLVRIIFLSKRLLEVPHHDSTDGPRRQK